MISSLTGQSFGRYHILEQLGEGGMAVVYTAFDTRLERNVAIKVILLGKEHSEKFLKRFEREAKALASLSHPNIVKVIDYSEHEGLPYLVMEYLPGGTLKSKLSGKSMPWQEAAGLLLPIARALAYAHEHKIIHRDIKPSNILVTESGEPMLSDFGIAKILEAEETLDLTGTGVGVGTPEYMSPEQAQGKQVDARSDIYSLGVVLYEMVTGRKPYQADTPIAVVYKLASEPMPRPKNFAPDLPINVEQFLLKALAKRPEDRYQNFAEFGENLEVLQAGVRKPRYPPSSRSRSWLKGAGRMLIAMLLVAIGGTASYFLFAGNGTSVSTPAAPEPTVTSTIIPTVPVEGKTFYDGFDDPVWEGKINSSLWSKRDNCVSVSQENGNMVFKNSNKGCDLILKLPEKVRGEELGALEAKLMVGDDHKGGIVTQEIDFFTYDLPGGLWWSFVGFLQKMMM